MTVEARAQAEREIAAVNAAMIEGCGLGFCSTKPSAIRVAARQLGVDRNALRERVGTPEQPGRYFRQHGLMPDWSLAAKADPIIVPEAPRWSAPRMSEARRHRPVEPPRPGETIRVLALGDVHAKPGRSTETVTLAGRHAAATRPDHIVQIGDWLSLDSCSMHSAKGSNGHQKLPTFVEDLEAGEESLAAFDAECPRDIPRDICLGNHENRGWRWADAEPKIASDIPRRITDLFGSYGWTTHDYGKVAMIHSVGFVHVPLTVMAKPYGGKNSENTIANDLTHSLVWGHDHRFRFKQVAKIGDNNRIGLCNLGTAMPWGVTEDYTVGNSGWTYGTVDLTIRDGQLVGARFFDAIELRQMYG
jgi:hypothetical protein